jgi:hypothetical protein
VFLGLREKPLLRTLHNRSLSHNKRLRVDLHQIPGADALEMAVIFLLAVAVPLPLQVLLARFLKSSAKSIN